MRRKAAYWAMMVAMVLLATELLMRLAHIQDTYSEQTGGGYVSYYNQVLPNWYHSWTPNQDIVINEPELKYRYRANSIGVREREIPKDKPDSMKRLFFLGDSFTEGHGVLYPYSMPRWIEKQLDSAKLNYEVYNVGVSGSDPLYQYVQLRDQLMPLHPTHVIMTINGSDITDVIFRGGMERFHADGTTHYRKGPWWQWLHHYSRIFRFVRASIKQDDDQTFLSKAGMFQAQEVAKKEIFDCLLATKKLCDEHGIKLVIVAHTFPTNFTERPLNDFMLEMTKQYPMQQVNLLSTFDEFALVMNKENYLDYSLKINGHFNEKGYHLFGDIVFSKINHQYPGYWQ